ncbi:transferase [Priestia megaterium]|uniref:transferase n=1 Tax=Priestia megaterium TaxID=1404 RepID=UPI000BFD7FAF|nr:transferase [Priestia megaterium]PGT72617.1 transferase [Priestia megaterium]
MKFTEKVNLIIGLPKSLIFNIRAFGLKKGIKMPLLLGYRCKYRGIRKGGIDVNENYKFGHVKIGINYGPFDKGIKENTIVALGEGGKLSFHGNCNISSGSVINVSTGTCIFGKRFAANSKFLLSCEKKIVFGDDILFGWSCTVIDGDGHSIIDAENGEILNIPQSIEIDSHVWVAAESTILKGAYIPKNSVIGYGSIVSKKFNIDNCIIAGVPAKVVAENRNWIR